jgi:hypothetical protein
LEEENAKANREYEKAVADTGKSRTSSDFFLKKNTQTTTNSELGIIATHRVPYGGNNAGP